MQHTWSLLGPATSCERLRKFPVHHHGRRCPSRNRLLMCFLTAAALLLPLAATIAPKDTVLLAEINKQLGVEERLRNDERGEMVLVDGDILQYAKNVMRPQTKQQGFLQNKAEALSGVGWTFWKHEFNEERGKWVVAYTISTDTNDQIRGFIATTMAIIEREGNLEFRARRNDDSWFLRFEQGSGCYALLGRGSPGLGGQPVSVLNHHCYWLGAVMHETAHAIGFPHEDVITNYAPFISHVSPSHTGTPRIGNVFDLLSLMCSTYSNAYKKRWNNIGGKGYFSSCDWNVMNIAYDGPIPPTPCVAAEFVVHLFEPLESCISSKGFEVCNRRCTYYDVASAFLYDGCKFYEDRKLPPISNEWMIYNCAD